MNIKKPHCFLTLSLILIMIAAQLIRSPFLLPVTAAGSGSTFVDPTVSLGFQPNVHLGLSVYIGPFASLQSGALSTGIFGADARNITIGSESNVQDNVTIDASAGAVEIGEQAIVAHGATVRGVTLSRGLNFNLIHERVSDARVGVGGVCPGGAARCPSFVSFNALVEGATIQKDAMVSALARVGPFVTIPSGFKVLPGKNVTSSAQVDLSRGKVAPVTEADREFMNGVIEVNLCFAEKYAELAADDPTNVLGINFDPGRCAFNPNRDLPKLGSTHTPTRETTFRNRIIGDVRLENTLAELNAVMGSRISLRADEGEAFEVGTIASMGDGVIFHALEHTHLHLGNGGNYGVCSIVHGGPTDFNDTTITGDNFSLGAQSVFFRSRIGDNSRVGFKSLVQQSDLPANTTIGDYTIIISNVEMGVVEW